MVPTIIDTVRSHLRGLQQAMADAALPESGGPSPQEQAAVTGSPAAEAALRLMLVNHVACLNRMPSRSLVYLCLILLLAIAKTCACSLWTIVTK